jgi:tRNA threonylcarbamoyladenosine biosynthesis protein TsaB
MQCAGDPAITHGARLPGDLMRALDSAGARLDDVGLLAVSAGPGSFTGLRVGIATMQGLAFARGLSIVAVPTLEALGFEGAQQARDGELVAAWIDAQRGEVFATLDAAPATVGRPDEILESWRRRMGDRRVLFIGDGVIRYRALVESLTGARLADPAPLVAGAVARIAARAPERAVIPHAVVPIYVRKSDAELARDRRAKNEQP